MLRQRLLPAFSLIALASVAACGGGEEVENADAVLMDTVTQTQTEMVEVPVQTTDTALVRTQIEVDTAVDVDTIRDPGR